MNKLHNGTIQLIRLIQRSPNAGAGWRKVHPTLWPHVKPTLQAELFEINEAQHMVRLSGDGQVIARYL